MAMFALSATFAPAIGPTIGGYLTRNLWLAVHLLRQPGARRDHVGRAAAVAAACADAAGAAARGRLARHRDDGHRACFAADGVWRKATRTTGSARRSSCVCRWSPPSRLALFLWIELTAEQPLLNLRLLLRRNFGLGSIANVILGMALYGSVFLLPSYLSQMQGYNSQQVGEVLAWTGLPQLVLIPFVPRLMRRFDARLLVAVGLGLFAASCFLNIDINQDYSGPQLLFPNLVRAIGQALVMTPLSVLATGGIETRTGRLGLGDVQHDAQPRRLRRHCRCCKRC